MHMTKNEAAFLGFVVACAVPAVLLAVIAPLSGTLGIASFVGTFVIVFFYSAIAALVFGAPIFLLFRRIRRVTWWSALIGGCLAGALTSVLIRLPGPPNVHDLLIDAPMGAACGFAFWLIWKQGRDPKTVDE